MFDASVLIVSYNTRDMTLACLRSVFAQTPYRAFEVIVVDNASTDGSAQTIAERFPDVRLFALDRNIGFAAANNFAARHATGEWLLLLNPDTVVLDNAIDKLVAFAEAHPEASIFCGRTLFADGSLNPTSCWAKPTIWSMFCLGSGLSALLKDANWAFPAAMRDWKRDTIRQVDIVTGCFFLIRRSLWEQLGGFDPAFFMYGEEADLCLRAAKLGHKCMICPDATIIHYGGASEKVRADKMVRLFRAKAQLFRRHWSASAARFGVAMLDLWALTRMAGFAAASLVKPRHRENFQTWREVWSKRAEWHHVDTNSPASVPIPEMTGSELAASGKA